MNKPTTSRMGKTIKSRRFIVAVFIEPAPDFPDEYMVSDYAEDCVAVTDAIHELAEHWDRETDKAINALQTGSADGGR